VIGLFTSALFVTHAGMQVPSGRLVDRLGAWTIGLFGQLVIGATSAVALLAPNAGLALSARLVAGVGTAFVFVAGSDYVRASGGSAFAQGAFGASSLAAGGLALALVPYVEDAVGWRAPFLTALVVAALGLALLLIAPPSPVHPRQPFEAGVLRDLRLMPFAWLHTASFGLSVVVANWLPTLLTRNGPYSEGQAGAIAAFTLALGVLTRPFGGWVRRSRPARVGPLLAASLVAGAAGTVLLVAVVPAGLVLAASAVVGLAGGIPFAISFTGATDVRPDAPGVAVGVVNGVAATTILLATPLVGLTFSLPGDGRLGFVVVGAAWAAALLAVPGAVRAIPRRGS
jgi:MFS transporter, NNP family, nitrate/nitrite transporter